MPEKDDNDCDVVEQTNPIEMDNWDPARSIELAAPTQDIVCMGGGSGYGMPSEVSHLRFDVIILDIKRIPQQFLWRDNLQWSILSIPPCIDVTLHSHFLFFWSKIRCVDIIVGNVTYSK